jgi:nucleotidyltransferase/DNA polymerase involved in DNA repair
VHEPARRLLCARHPHLGLVAALRRHPELRGEAAIVGGAPELRLPVLAASVGAAACGVAAGQPLRQAQQLCPQAAFVSVDSGDLERLRAEVATALGGLSPAVESGDEESYCDLSGSHVAYPDEGRWAAAIARTLMETLDGELPCVGVAGTRFVAHIAALASEPRHVRRVPAGTEAAFLAPLPLGLLPVDPAIGARLAALGLDCLGAVANLSPVELQRQFGAEGLALHRHCRGEDEGALRLDPAPRRAVERVVLDGAVSDLEVLRFAAHRCATDLGEQLRNRGLVAVSVALVLELEEAPGQRVTVPPPLPAGNAADLWAAVLGLLGEVRPQAPVTALRLEVELRGAAGRQADLWRGGDAEREQVLAAAARLQRRYGETALRRPRLATDPGDLPERRFHWDAPVPAEMAAHPAAPAIPAGSPASRDGSADLVARSSTQPAQKGKVPWSRPAASRPPTRGHPRPTPSAQTALHQALGRTHV